MDHGHAAGHVVGGSPSRPQHLVCMAPDVLAGLPTAPHHTSHPASRRRLLAFCTPPSASPAGCVENQLLGNTASGVPWSRLQGARQQLACLTWLDLHSCFRASEAHTRRVGLHQRHRGGLRYRASSPHGASGGHCFQAACLDRAVYGAASPPVLEQVDFHPCHLGQLVVQRRKLAQHLLGDRRGRLACSMKASSPAVSGRKS